MNSYSTMLIDALLIGFVLFTLIHGDLPQYVAFAKAGQPGASTGTAPTSAATGITESAAVGAANLASGGALQMVLQHGLSIGNSVLQTL